jgi:hypothetical protein
MAPAFENHSFLASEDPVLLSPLNHSHNFIVVLSPLRTSVNSFFNDHLLMRPELILSLNILLPLDVDHVLINLCLLYCFPVLTLSVLGHKLDKDRAEHQELRLLPVLDSLRKNALLVDYLINSVFPGSESSACLRSRNSHEVVS